VRVAPNTVTDDRKVHFAGPLVEEHGMARPIYKNLTAQVLVAIGLGILVGAISPATGKALEPVGQGFINLVKMIVPPVVFLTIVVGIAGMRDMNKAGRVGLKAIGYFLVFTTFALVIGMVVANVFRPGDGVQPKAQTAEQAAAAKTKIANYQQKAHEQDLTSFVLKIIPKSFFSAFTDGEMLQVLLVALLFGSAAAGLGERAEPILEFLESLSQIMFRIVNLIMRVAPIGAFGAMAYTIGEYGVESLVALAKLMACVYLTMAGFIFVVLWGMCTAVGVSFFGYLRFIKDEILLVLGTSSSESALPRMIEKLELMGCERSVVGMVIPAGYSFNLDGTSIYLSCAAIFISQALQMELSIGEQIYMLGVLVLTSKGAAAVTGGGFITLAATLGAVQPKLLPGLALVFGVDRFMSEARSITNLIGNGVATLVVSKWEGAFNPDQYRAAMSGAVDARLAAGGDAVRGFPVEVQADLGAEGER
jgi:aerobic C4-dicarboxylate transport protein